MGDDLKTEMKAKFLESQLKLWETVFKRQVGSLNKILF
jgi:hypothetical protein